MPAKRARAADDVTIEVKWWNVVKKNLPPALQSYNPQDPKIAVARGSGIDRPLSRALVEAKHPELPGLFRGAVRAHDAETGLRAIMQRHNPQDLDAMQYIPLKERIISSNPWLDIRFFSKIDEALIWEYDQVTLSRKELLKAFCSLKFVFVNADSEASDDIVGKMPRTFVE